MFKINTTTRKGKFNFVLQSQDQPPGFPFSFFNYTVLLKKMIEKGEDIYYTFLTFDGDVI